MSDSGDKSQWSTSTGEKADDGEMDCEEEEVTSFRGEEEGEGEEGEEEEDDVDSATYEAELEQEIDEAEVQEEVDKLQEESEYPLEQLIALYGLPVGSAAASSSSGAAVSASNRRTRLAVRRRAQDVPERGPPAPSRRRLDSPGASALTEEPEPTELASGTSAGAEAPGAGCSEDEDERLYSRMFARNRITFSSSSSGGGDSAEDDDDNDEDFDPGLPLDEKKIVQIGEAHQANVPAGLAPYPEHEKHKHDLSMVWDPSQLACDAVEKYLHRMYKDDLGRPFSEDDDYTSLEALKQRVPDDENLLFLLQRCNYDMNEAFRRRECQNGDEKAFPDYMSLWTEEEVGNFERGILHYGKNFHLIHAHKLCKRDVPQLVEFYYWWKKSARYENFVRAFKLDRRVPSQSGGAGATTSHGLESCPEEEESATGPDAALPHLNGGPGLAGESGEFMECLVDEQEFISGNYEEPAGAPSSPPAAVFPESDVDKHSSCASTPGEQPAFKPWDQHREKFDYELPRRAPCSVARQQKSPSKGSSRPKRASIMACL